VGSAFEVAARQTLVAAEQRRYDLSNLRYRQGVDSYLTVLTAQQDLYSAQSGLITTRTTKPSAVDGNRESRR
jgi:multidrug efflux system outer membrane protein